MKICDYVEFFPDENSGKQIYFQCKNEVYRSKRCKFHHAEYLKSTTRDEIIQLFSDKFKEAKEKNIPLECIGYNLPSISLIENGENELQIPIYFAHAQFKENVDFSSIIFKENVSFHKTTFFKTAKIRNAIFEKFIDFSFAEFYERNNSFSSTKFEGFSDFKNATIINPDFKWANFHDVVFLNCTFFGNTIFSNTIFSGKSEFIKTKFFGKTDFEKSVFSNNTNFDDAKFSEYTNFTQVVFQKDKDVVFNSNISNISFVDTDIKKIIFGNKSSWQLQNLYNKEKKSKQAKKRKNRDFKIYEERLLEKNIDTNINLESVKNIYRDLRENFDMNLQYDISGEFFIREMELNRKYTEIYKNEKLITTKKFWWSRGLSPYLLYNLLAQYGQSIRRPIYFMIPLILLGTFVFWDECTRQVTTNLHSACTEPVYGSFIRSLSGFIPFFTFPENPILMDYILRLLLLPFSGIFFISLKRKFERKLRH